MDVPGAGWARPVFQVGKKKTLAVSMSMHKISREKVCAMMKSRGESGVILLQGGHEECLYDSDTELIFRQDSWFNYLFGVKEAGTYGAIDVATGKTTLFIPRLTETYRLWCGEIYPPSHFQQHYVVDEVVYVDELPAWMDANLSGGALHLMEGLNSDSGTMAKPAHFDGIERFESQVKKDVLHHVVSTARVVKSPGELELMRYCAMVASNAHVEVMRSAHAGMPEYELEATFLFLCYKNGGCRHSAYTSICACGPNASTLHYGHAAAPNDRILEETDLALLDMGCQYHGYCSDITCSFPISGKFSPEQRIVFEAVANAQRAVFEAAKPGVSWGHCHRMAEREILKGVQKLGILKAEATIDELVAANVGQTFFPHGLGHLLGCDTHDAGGYISGTPARSTAKGLGITKLRTMRDLEPGMVLTNEPGLYFIDFLMDQALNDPVQAQYIHREVLERFRNFGGVRLEDDFVVTETGVANFTTCPRTVAEVESVMAGGQWPPAVDEAPYLFRQWGKLANEGTGIEDITL